MTYRTYIGCKNARSNAPSPRLPRPKTRKKRTFTRLAHRLINLAKIYVNCGSQNARFVSKVEISSLAFKWLIAHRPAIKTRCCFLKCVRKRAFTGVARKLLTSGRFVCLAEESIFALIQVGSHQVLQNCHSPIPSQVSLDLV